MPVTGPRFLINSHDRAAMAATLQRHYASRYPTAEAALAEVDKYFVAVLPVATGAYDDRVRALSRMSKGALAREVRRGARIVWTARPLERWNKDELIAEVLRSEYPDGRPGYVATATIEGTE